MAQLTCGWELPCSAIGTGVMSRNRFRFAVIVIVIPLFDPSPLGDGGGADVRSTGGLPHRRRRGLEETAGKMNATAASILGRNWHRFLAAELSTGYASWQEEAVR